jgi:hypothetical protein
MAEAKKILKVLQDQLQIQTRHIRLLEAQQCALLACDRPRFCELQEEHASLLALLEKQEAARCAVMCDQAGNTVSLSKLLEGIPQNDHRNILAVSDSLKSALDRVRLLGQQNQQMIQNELEYLAFTLDLFMEAGRKADNTHAYGGSRPTVGTRMFLDRRA